MRIVIDGQDFGQCFTTWETYYRVSPAQSRPPNFSKPPNINSLQFRTSAARSLPNAGYLFDNVTVTTGTGPDSPGCDVTLDKQATRPRSRPAASPTTRSRPATAAVPWHATSVFAIASRAGRRSCAPTASCNASVASAAS